MKNKFKILTILLMTLSLCSCDIFSRKTTSSYSEQEKESLNENHVHIYDENSWHVVTEPTLKSTGELEKTCCTCYGVTDYLTLPKLNETDYEVRELTPSKCNQYGTGEYIFKYDGQSFVFYSNLPYGDHTTEGDSWLLTVTPTLESGGQLSQICTLCGRYLNNTKELPKLNAVDYEYNVIDPGTCNGTPGRAKYIYKIDTQTFTFPVIIDGPKHQGIWYVESAPTKTDNGCLQLDCTVCSGFDLHVLNPLNKIDYNYTVTKEPDCLNEGIGTYSITYENQTFNFTESIDSYGFHTYGSWQLTKTPTSTEEGEIVRYCTRGDTHNEKSIESITLPKLATNEGQMGFDIYTYQTIIRPTCTSTGTASCSYSIDGQTFSFTTTLIEPTSCSCHDYLSFSLINGGVGYYVSSLTDDSVTDVVIPEKVHGIAITHIFNGAFSKKAIKSVVIPDSVFLISNSAFSNCKELENVTMSNSLRFIYQEAFDGCFAIKELILPSTLTYLGRDSLPSLCMNIKYKGDLQSYMSINFADSTGTCFDYLYENNAWVEFPTDVIIPNTVTEIGDYQFCNFYKIKKITIPNSVTKIGEYAFKNCRALESVTIPSSVTSISSCAFYSCSSLTEITIPDSVTQYGQNIFMGCSSLNKIKRSANTNYIMAWEFAGCSSLTEFTITDNILGIGRYAFRYCTSLEYIILPVSVKTIDENVFDNCTSLKSIFYKGTVTEYASIASSSTLPEDCTVYYYLEAAPTTTGDYWHYVDDKPTVWPSYVENEE